MTWSSPRIHKATKLTSIANQRAGLEAEEGDELLFQIYYLESDRKLAEQQSKNYPEIEALRFNGDYVEADAARPI